MQWEINDLKRKLRHAQRRQSHLNLDLPFNDESDDDYRQRSRTSPSEIFSHEEEHYQRRKHRGPSPRGLGHDAMSKALDQLSKSPFTRRINGLHSLSDSSSQPSPFITAIQTPWSRWASSTKGWMSTLKTRRWCVRFSYPAWDQWRWGGSMA